MRVCVCVCVCVCESVLLCTRVCAGTPVQPLTFLHLLDPSCAHVFVTFSCFSPFFFSFFSFVPCWCVGGAYTCICRRFKTALFLAGHRALLLSVEMFSVFILFLPYMSRIVTLTYGIGSLKKKQTFYMYSRIVFVCSTSSLMSRVVFHCCCCWCISSSLCFIVLFWGGGCTISHR